jgi:hypothetical protein
MKEHNRREFLGLSTAGIVVLAGFGKELKIKKGSVQTVIEDTFNGSKNALTTFFAYFNAVAQEIGMERALALHTKMAEVRGANMGKMLKEQSALEEFDPKAAASLARNSIEKGYGISSEVIEESPQSVVFKVGRCPLYEAAQELGLDAEVIETLCRAGALRFMYTTVKQLNPNLNYKLRKFRSAADDFCEEEIVLG